MTTQRLANGDIRVPAYWCLEHEEVHQGEPDDFGMLHYVKMRPLTFLPYPHDRADVDPLPDEARALFEADPSSTLEASWDYLAPYKKEDWIYRAFLARRREYFS